jgi:hypothetical protein
MTKELKFSFFKSNKTKDKPDGELSLEQLITGIKEGAWAKAIEALRKRRNDPGIYKRLKDNLPGVTVSALLKTRDVKVPIDKRLVNHTGLIAIDIDKKDNPGLTTTTRLDRDALAEFVSPGGEGKKLIYRCQQTRDPATHRRIFDACVQRLEKLGVNIKVDPIVKSLVGVQYVSYDPEAFYNPKTKLVVKALPPVLRKKTKPTKDQEQLIQELNEYIEALGKTDVTKDYENWLNVMFGLAHSFSEAGRDPMHKICKNYPGYSKIECDEKYDACLESTQQAVTPVTIATVFQILSDGMGKLKARQLSKKYNKVHAVAKVGKGEEITEGAPELIGLVKYKLFLFKTVTDSKTKEILDLQLSKINLNAFELLLQTLGFYRYEKLFVHIKDNIVDTVDTPDILHRVTQCIEQDGDYVFTYRDVEYRFSWEDVVHKWREIRALSTTGTQISASLKHWHPLILKDRPNESYIPYQNGVVVVNAKSIELKQYKDVEGQVWRERILPRNFRVAKRIGMFEQFFANVMGRGHSHKERIKSDSYKRAVWYYGYMLQGTKRQSTARAWLLYDIRTGNNGRSGKTIIGSAVGHIRSVAVIDGKRVDLNDRFAFQNVQPWNDIIFIDDPAKSTSLVPLFNMISGTTLADRKTIAPIVKDLKIMIASNWILESAGTSESGRQFVSQLSDYYIDYAKKNKNTIQPIVDLHGKEFFTDWDDRDWAEFDNFSLKALQRHLKERAPDNTIIGNSAQIRFMQLYEEEMFYSLCVNLIENARSANGITTIVHGLMTDAIKENSPDLKRPGTIAKDFLRSLGAFDIANTTVKVGTLPRMAWTFKPSLEELNWGELKSRLPKIK